jgi:hypothetical protein
MRGFIERLEEDAEDDDAEEDEQKSPEGVLFSPPDLLIPR